MGNIIEGAKFAGLFCNIFIK